ncbi:MAG: M48 family metalloprotease [Gammaproteobacteria bacterium]|nr:M48 family metalloprotease [Gammaproteobacteria bacterium]
MNTFSYIFIFALLTGFFLQWVLTQRQIGNVRRHRQQVPEAFSDKISIDEHQKAADYTVAKASVNQAELVLTTLVLLVWTLGGGLQWLDAFWRALSISDIPTGVGFIFSVVIIGAMIDIPFSVYRTFKLEQKFGFNKTTLKTFISDIIKNTIIMSLIGLPLLALILWIMQASGSLWWLYVWLTWFGFSLLMMWAYPAFIAPLFNEFRPLEEGELKTRIESLLARNGFTSQGIFVMDGSSRSTHGNAYFTGLGANKRIVFFDTLIKELSADEIEAVLAHELGHFKCHHIRKRIIMLGAVFLAGFAVLGWLIDLPWFYLGLGVESASSYMALILFVLVAPVFTLFLQPLFSQMSRKHEFEADDFAAAQADASHLIQALVKLYKENANTLTPDPLYSAFHDSHPPAPIRIAHLSSATS